MIRPLTLLSLLAAGGAGLHLYSVKHEVSTLERQLRDIGRQTEAARERTAVLRAEWALLNEPERLRAAAARHLPLETMQTAQFVRPQEMERRLPTAVAFAGAPSLFTPDGATMVASATPAAVAAAVAAVPALASDAPANAAAPRPGTATPAVAPAATPPVAARPAAPSAPLQVAAAPARPAPRPAESARRPPETAQAVAPATPTIRPAIYVTPAPRQPEPPVPTGSVLGGSVLSGGGRPMLAPPVPFGTANAATAFSAASAAAPPAAR